MLFEAVGGRGDLVVVKIILGQYGKQALNVRDGDDMMYPLHRAVYYGRVDIIRFLILEGDADVECLDNQGRTPLHVAMDKNRMTTVQLLLEEFSVAIDPVDKDGKTPLDLGILGSNLEAVKYLIAFKEARAVEGVKDFAAKLLSYKPDDVRNKFQEEAREQYEGRIRVLQEEVIQLASEKQQAVEAMKKAASEKAEMVGYMQRVTADADEMMKHTKKMVAEKEGVVDDFEKLMSDFEKAKVGKEHAMKTVNKLTNQVEQLITQTDLLTAERDRVMKLWEEDKRRWHNQTNNHSGEGHPSFSPPPLPMIQEGAEDGGEDMPLPSAQTASSPKVFTGKVRKLRNSSRIEIWDDRFLVVGEGTLKYYHTEKDYLLGSGTKAPDVYELALYNVTALPGNDCTFFLTPKHGTNNSRQLWLRGLSTVGKDAWVKAIQATGASIADYSEGTYV